METRASALVILLTILCAPPAAQAAGPLRAQLVASGLDQPLFATAPAGDPRLFVVERAGRIRIVRPDGSIDPQPFLDITGNVGTANERGFLGIAFPSDHAESGAFYAYYTDTAGDSVLSRFRVEADPDLVDPATEEMLLVVPQPFANHNGGTIAFGPDGFLYLGLGDGGSSNDPAERAQDPTTLLGKMLRLDVGEPPAPGSLPQSGAGYAIPGDNPFVGDPGTLDEIWAFGLRNPYRFSFDRETGDLWIADVGQGAREEVDLEPAGDPGGRNYGWDVMEGSLCNPNDPAAAPPCMDASLTLPVHEYAHTDGNCSITGGFVSRATAGPLPGRYFFGDFCTGRIWTYDPATGAVADRSADLGDAALDAFQLGGFGEDALGLLYVVHRDGDLFRIEASPECANGEDDDGDGAVDFPEDMGCRDADWNFEDPACENGVDDDGDGLTDLDDPECGAAWQRSESPGCGLGPGLALVLPLLGWLRRRGGSRRSG